MRIISGFCVREILDEVIAIPTGQAAQSFSGVISLNELGRFLFERLNQDQSVDTLVEAVTAEYEVDAATARADVEEFLTSLREKNLLVEE